MKTLPLIGLVALCGCGEKVTLGPPYVPDPNKPQRHFESETTWIWAGNRPYQRVDTAFIRGHEYIVHNLGGIVHSESCTNHTKATVRNGIILTQ